MAIGELSSYNVEVDDSVLGIVWGSSVKEREGMRRRQRVRKYLLDWGHFIRVCYKIIHRMMKLNIFRFKYNIFMKSLLTFLLFLHRHHHHLLSCCSPLLKCFIFSHTINVVSYVAQILSTTIGQHQRRNRPNIIKFFQSFNSGIVEGDTNPGKLFSKRIKILLHFVEADVDYLNIFFF